MKGPVRHLLVYYAAAAVAAAALGACAPDPVSGASGPRTDPFAGPPAGNPSGACAVPAEAAAEDVSRPDEVVGDGAPESCTAEAFIAAVARGGVIVFDCGPDPVTIVLPRPAKVFNDARPDIVIDGGGKVALSGGGATRILYMNTCDQAQAWTTPHCDDQDHPRLTVQNLAFVDGNSETDGKHEGGGAIWARGGRFKAVACRFFNNVCAREGPDVGGGAIRAFDQHRGQPIHLTGCAFGGAEGYGNTGANGGGISSIGVSWTIRNSVFSHNRAVGRGGNPARPGTPGGGSGGAIYNDGNAMTLSLCGTIVERNEATAHGAGIFFVSNDITGSIAIRNSIIRGNVGGTWYALPGISMHETTRREVVESILE